MPSTEEATSHIARACSIILSKLEELREGCPYIDDVLFLHTSAMKENDKEVYVEMRSVKVQAIKALGTAYLQSHVIIGLAIQAVSNSRAHERSSPSSSMELILVYLHWLGTLFAGLLSLFCCPYTSFGPNLPVLWTILLDDVAVVAIAVLIAWLFIASFQLYPSRLSQYAAAICPVAWAWLSFTFLYTVYCRYPRLVTDISFYRIHGSGQETADTINATIGCLSLAVAIYWVTTMMMGLMSLARGYSRFYYSRERGLWEFNVKSNLLPLVRMIDSILETVELEAQSGFKGHKSEEASR